MFVEENERQIGRNKVVEVPLVGKKKGKKKLEKEEGLIFGSMLDSKKELDEGRDEKKEE